MPPRRGIAGKEFLREALAEEEEADNSPNEEVDRAVPQAALKPGSHPAVRLPQGDRVQRDQIDEQA